ncbi:GTP-binding protein [Sulfitobacter porphyrae]|uniref:GTP-binding protein n=1 Tax=Sulfitobacter porphyrae TaxID=1246864 RepID=A0ABW2B718_9RHOB
MLLNKTDLVDANGLTAVTEWLRSRIPGIRVLPLDQGAAPVAAVLGTLPFPARRGPAPDHHHARFETLLLTPDGPVDAQVLASALAADEGVTRAKGFVETSEGLALIHVVGARGTAVPAEGNHDIGVVCIGASEVFDAEALQGLMETSRRPSQKST